MSDQTTISPESEAAGVKKTQDIIALLALYDSLNAVDKARMLEASRDLLRKEKEALAKTPTH